MTAGLQWPRPIKDLPSTRDTPPIFPIVRQSPVVFVLSADVAFQHRIHIRPERLPPDPDGRPNRQGKVRVTQIPKRRDVLSEVSTGTADVAVFPAGDGAVRGSNAGLNAFQH